MCHLDYLYYLCLQSKAKVFFDVYTVLGLVEGTEENKDEKWMCHSQAIAATMSNRMEELGMTQRALAEKMNCTQQYVSKVLKGRENLSLETLCKIENALGIRILQAGIDK